jgi:hypothetical protein
MFMLTYVMVTVVAKDTSLSSTSPITSLSNQTQRGRIGKAAEALARKAGANLARQEQQDLVRLKQLEVHFLTSLSMPFV